MKKNAPLIVLEMLQPLVSSNSDIIEQIKAIDSFYHIVDKDENSDFYFKVLKKEAQNGKEFFRLEYKPRSKDNTTSIAPLVERAALTDKLNSWIKIIRGYSEIHTVYDDPLTQAYQQSFEKEFQIVDEDADFAPFNLQQQLFLNEYLERVQHKVNELQEGKSEIEVKELKELNDDVSKIQANLTKESKRKIIKALTWLWAKAQKIGLPVLKEVFLTSVKELTKHIITGL